MSGLQRRRSSRNLLKLDVLAAEKHAQEHLQKEAETGSCFSPHHHLCMYLLDKVGARRVQEKHEEEGKLQNLDKPKTAKN
jgi:hypothetical protein